MTIKKYDSVNRVMVEFKFQAFRFVNLNLQEVPKSEAVGIVVNFHTDAPEFYSKLTIENWQEL